MHKTLLASSGTRALGSIISKYKLNKDMYFEVFSKLYNTCVVPVLDYGSEVWGLHKCTEVERVQNHAARVFLGVNRYTPILSIQGDTGWQLCQTRINLNMLRFWNRLLSMGDDRLCKHIFLWDHELQYNIWSCYIKDLLNVCNLDIFERKIVCDML